jgi:hypothetical protein
MTFKLGDGVCWTSQSAGSTAYKRGFVVEIVGPGRRPIAMAGDLGGVRDHQSYVVEAAPIRALGRIGRKRAYWPRVSQLRPDVNCPHCTSIQGECDCQEHIDCPLAGEPLHKACGYCTAHDCPRFACLHMHP